MVNFFYKPLRGDTIELFKYAKSGYNFSFVVSCYPNMILQGLDVLGRIIKDRCVVSLRDC